MDITFLLFGLFVALLVKLFVENLPDKNAQKKAVSSSLTESRVATVVGLYVFPIKSCHGIQVEEAIIGKTGFKWDRHWMLVRPSASESENKRFVTARQFPSMGDFLHVDAPGMETLKVPLQNNESANFGVDIWADKTFAGDEGDEAAAWFNKYLSAKHPAEFQKLGPLRLVRYFPKAPSQARATTASADNSSNEVSFADAHPFLLVSQESVDEINRRVSEFDVDRTRFRGNIIISGYEKKLTPFQEENWSSCTIGSSHFSCICPVERCRLTTIEPDKGYFEESQQPLLTVNNKEQNPKHFGVGIQHTKESEGQVVKVGMKFYAM